jgi:hypothetical protein
MHSAQTKRFLKVCRLSSAPQKVHLAFTFLIKILLSSIVKRTYSNLLISANDNIPAGIVILPKESIFLASI